MDQIDQNAPLTGWRYGVALVLGSNIGALASSAALSFWLYSEQLIDAGLSLVVLSLLLFVAEGANWLGLVLLGPLGAVRNRRTMIVAACGISSLLLLTASLMPLNGWLLAPILFGLGVTGFADAVVRSLLVSRLTRAGDKDGEGRVAGNVTAICVVGYLLCRLPVLVGWRLGLMLLAGAMAIATAAAARLLPEDSRNVDKSVRWSDALRELGPALRNPLVLIPALVGLVGGIGFRALFAVQPSLVSIGIERGARIDLLGLTLDEKGAWIALFQVTNVVAAIGSAWLGARVGRAPRACLIGTNMLLVAALAGLLVLPALDADQRRIGLLLVCALADTATNMAMVPVFAAAGRDATATSVVICFRVLAMAIGAAIAGPLVRLGDTGAPMEVAGRGDTVTTLVEYGDLGVLGFATTGFAVLGTLIAIAYTRWESRTVDIGIVAANGLSAVPVAVNGVITFEGPKGARLVVDPNSRGGRLDALVTFPGAGLDGKQRRLSAEEYVALVTALRMLSRIAKATDVRATSFDGVIHRLINAVDMRQARTAITELAIRLTRAIADELGLGRHETKALVNEAMRQQRGGPVGRVVHLAGLFDQWVKLIDEPPVEQVTPFPGGVPDGGFFGSKRQSA